MIVDESPKVTVNKHQPTGAAEVAISFWLDEDEQKGLIDRLFSRQTLLHDRERVIEALRIVNEEPKHNSPGADRGENSSEQSWEVTLE